MSLEINSAIVLLSHEGINLIEFSYLYSDRYSCGRKGEQLGWCSLSLGFLPFQYLLSYGFRKGCGYCFMAGQILHFHWSKSFMADKSMVWLNYNTRLFTKNVASFMKWCLLSGFSFSFFDLVSYFKRVYIFCWESCLVFFHFPNQKAYKQAHRNSCCIPELFKFKNPNFGWTASKVISQVFFRNTCFMTKWYTLHAKVIELL